MSTTPAITCAARRPSCASAWARVRAPGKAQVHPRRKPAAAAKITARSSVTPWIRSQPPSCQPSPARTYTASSAPPLAPLSSTSMAVGAQKAKPSAKANSAVCALWVNREEAKIARCERPSP